MHLHADFYGDMQDPAKARLILIRGAVPGSKGAWILVRDAAAMLVIQSDEPAGHAAA